MTTPNAMPSKAHAATVRSPRRRQAPNPAISANLSDLRQSILSALLDNKQYLVRDGKGKPAKDDDGNRIVRGTLANNVSNENVERAARRWVA